LKYLDRHITPRIKEALKFSPIIFLNGARQTGKSTLVQTIARGLSSGEEPAPYVTLDRPVLLASASSAPEAFLTGYHGRPVTIDEVQLAPPLFRALKIVVDEERTQEGSSANGKYLLTGSANILALPKLADPLVGRMAILTLYPFTAAEATHNISGGIERLLQLDFKNVTDRGFSLMPWHRNVGKRLVKSAKGYFIDTNLICHLLDYNMDDVALTKPGLFRSLLENFVATELVKQLSNSELKAELYHFRTSDGVEVDFILERPDGSLLAVEVKRAETVNMADFKGIKVFQELAGKDFIGGIVLYSGKDVAPFGNNLWAVPFSVLWYPTRAAPG